MPTSNKWAPIVGNVRDIEGCNYVTHIILHSALLQMYHLSLAYLQCCTAERIQVITLIISLVYVSLAVARHFTTTTTTVLHLIPPNSESPISIIKKREEVCQHSCGHLPARLCALHEPKDAAWDSSVGAAAALHPRTGASSWPVTLQCAADAPPPPPLTAWQLCFCRRVNSPVQPLPSHDAACRSD